MFYGQYADLRSYLLENDDLRAIGDFAVGAFDEVPNDLLSVVVSIFRRCSPSEVMSIALQPTALDDKSYDRERTKRKRSATVCGQTVIPFRTSDRKKVPDEPLVYWWTKETFALS